MTREEIIKLARDAGIYGTETSVATTFDDLEDFAALVAAKEREACAVAAWSTGMGLHMKAHDAREIGSACAKAIRARGN